MKNIIRCNTYLDLGKEEQYIGIISVPAESIVLGSLIVTTLFDCYPPFNRSELLCTGE